MGLWKRVQRIGKKAAKFDFILSYSGLEVECEKSSEKSFGGGKQLCINWTRKNRNKRTKTYDPVCAHKSCHIDFPVPEVVNSKITLYRSNNEHELDDKYWNLLLELVDKTGRIKPIANSKMNMREYAINGLVREVSFNLTPLKSEYKSVVCRFKISCHLIKEGLATDDDMVSLASLMSYGEESSSQVDTDVGNLNDFSEFETPDTNFQTPVSSFASFTAQMGEFMKITEDDDVDEGDIWKLNQTGGKLTPNDVEQTAAVHSETDSSPRLYIGSPPVSPVAPRTHRHTEVLTANSSVSPTPPVKPPRKHLAELPHLTTEEQSTATKELTSLDLLDWAKEVTKNYELVKIINYTTSFRNGMAFAAILHYYKPDLIDFQSLRPRTILENNQIVIKLAAKLGIPCIMRAEDMAHTKIPDKLLVKTFLHEIRSYFHGVISPEIVQTQKPALSDIIFGGTHYETQSNVQQNSSSYPSLVLLNRREDLYRTTIADSVTTGVDDVTVGTVNEDMIENKIRSDDLLEIEFEQNLEENLSELPKMVLTNKPTKPEQSNVKTHIEQTTEQASHRSTASSQSPVMNSTDQQPTASKTKQSTNSQQLTVPFIVLNQLQSNWQSTVHTDVHQLSNNQPATTPSSKNQPFLSSTYSNESSLPIQPSNSSIKDQTTRFSTDGALERSSVKNKEDEVMSGTNNSVQYEERGTVKPPRKLMTHKELTNPFDSDSDEDISDPTHTNPFLVHDSSVDEIKTSTTADVTYNRTISTSSSRDSVRTNPFLSDPNPIHNSTDRQYQHVNKIFSTSEYVLMAMADVDRQQRELDEEAGKLEVRLRRAMSEGRKAKEEELSRCWFSLLNNKNNLIRRMEQLNILEKEENLNTRYELLTRELRRFDSRKDWEKSDEERKREQALLDELVMVVDKRNELIMAIEEQNQCLDADDATALEVEKNLRSSVANGNQQCSIQ